MLFSRESDQLQNSSQKACFQVSNSAGLWQKGCLVPRPVRAIRVTRGGLEPSAIARGLAKNGKKAPIDEKKSQLISRRKSFDFCDDHGIFRTHEINTSLPSIFGPFQLIATKCGGHVFPKTLVSYRPIHTRGFAYCLQSCSLHEASKKFLRSWAWDDHCILYVH